MTIHQAILPVYQAILRIIGAKSILNEAILIIHDAKSIVHEATCLVNGAFLYQMGKTYSISSVDGQVVHSIPGKWKGVWTLTGVQTILSHPFPFSVLAKKNDSTLAISSRLAA